jgi:hypothetical protein
MNNEMLGGQGGSEEAPSPLPDGWELCCGKSLNNRIARGYAFQTMDVRCDPKEQGSFMLAWRSSDGALSQGF